MSTGAKNASGPFAWAPGAIILFLALAGAVAITNHHETGTGRAANTSIPLTGYGDFAAARGTVLWNSGQQGWHVQLAGLPPIPSFYRYRIWAVSADGNLHDCGELLTQADDTARHLILSGNMLPSLQGFAVTIEPSGTRPTAPSTPAVLISPGIAPADD